MSLVAKADNSSDPAKQWRNQLESANKSYELQDYQTALKTAERFGERDPRLLETLVRIVEYCDDGMCADKEQADYLARAHRVRLKTEPKDAVYADLLVRLGSASTIKEAEGIAALNEALKLRQSLFGPTNEKMADTWVAIAWFQARGAKEKEARAAMEHALAVSQAWALNTAKAQVLDQSAQLYTHAKDQQHAEMEWDREVALLRKLWKPGDPKLVEALQAITSVYSGPDDHYPLALLKSVVAMQKQVFGEQSEEYRTALMALGTAQHIGRHYLDAVAEYRLSLTVRNQSKVTEAETWRSIAESYIAAKNFPAAIEADENALRLKESSLETLGQLARAYALAGDPEKAQNAFARLSGSLNAKTRTISANTARELSRIYEEQGDLERAAQKLEQYLAIVEVGDANDLRIEPAMAQLVKLYQSMGRVDDANRMQSAYLHRSMAKNWQNQKFAAAIGVVGIVLLIGFIAGPIAFGVAFLMVSRRLDRQVASLFYPPPPPPPSAPLEILPPTSEALNVPEPGEVPAAPVRPPPPPPASAIVLAEGGTLFAMRVLNLLLSLLTLGIYSFWGKAKTRKYVCGQTEFAGDRFAFHGTGRELLLGWLRALPFFAFIFLFPTMLPLGWRNPWSPVVAQAAVFLALAVLWPVARAGAHRYRLNRMSWRGIRFSFRGSTWKYMLASLGGSILTALTLGFYGAFREVELRRRLLDETYFGNRSFRYHGKAIDLLPCYLIAIPLSLCTFGLGWVWWSAVSERYTWANTTFGPARFRCSVTGPRLLWLWVCNVFLAIVTLGFALPWITLRSLRFWADNIQLVGDPELQSVRQEIQLTTAVGESFADYLGFDFGV